MTTQFVNTANNSRRKTFINKNEAAGSFWTLWHVGVGIGLLGGTFILFCAGFLTVFQYFYGEAQHGVWLYAIVLPLWLFGAHCLDKVEAIEKAARIEYCRKHGMTDDDCAKLEVPPKENFKGF